MSYFITYYLVNGETVNRPGATLAEVGETRSALDNGYRIEWHGDYYTRIMPQHVVRITVDPAP